MIKACGEHDAECGGEAGEDVVKHHAQGIVATVGPADGAKFGDVKETEGEEGKKKAGPKA